jgi:hypothetical protein
MPRIASLKPFTNGNGQALLAHRCFKKPRLRQLLTLAISVVLLGAGTVCHAVPVAFGTSTGGMGPPPVVIPNGLHTLAGTLVTAGANGGLFDVSSSVSYLGSTSGGVQTLLFVDGVAVNEARNTWTSNGYESVSLPGQLTLSPGVHNIELKVGGSLGTTAYSPFLAVTAYNEIATVPEPSSLTLAGIGMAGAFFGRRRRKAR